MLHLNNEGETLQLICDINIIPLRNEFDEINFEKTDIRSCDINVYITYFYKGACHITRC